MFLQSISNFRALAIVLIVMGHLYQFGFYHQQDDIFSEMIKNELTRVIYFASLSRNYYDAMEVCRPVAEEYGLDIFALEDELKGEL